MSHRTLRPAAALLVLALGCRSRAASGPPRVPVTVARAEQRAVPFEIAASGTVEPRQTASVQAQVTGIITSVTFREGDDVTQGQLLFQIDPRPLRAALDQANAALARDVAQAQNAQLEADRYGQLVQQDYVTKEDYDEKRATAAALAATVRGDSAMVATAALNLAWTSIRAPIAGRTGRLLVRAGNLVRANTDPLVLINQIHPILVRFAVPSQQLPGVQRHRGNQLPVLVSPSNGDTTVAEGSLTFVDNSVDTTTGTVLLKAEFANADNALWPGEFVSVRLRLYVQDSALVIPAQAVMSGQQGTYVFVVSPDGKAQSQAVTVARTSSGYAIIAQGVRAGDQVVTDGQLRLVSGTAVEIKGGDGVGGEIEANR
ncbi:MAG TPA: efflux RND transporter periplasmic adaptor subunit [Gemmatimonadales bacterium]|nr:efflux RND transporter periplasmic adaptor subunit [Gemmatimonadales bacterium]